MNDGGSLAGKLSSNAWSMRASRWSVVMRQQPRSDAQVPPVQLEQARRATMCRLADLSMSETMFAIRHTEAYRSPITDHDHWRPWLRDATALPPNGRRSAMTQHPNRILNAL